MARKNKILPLFENVEILDAGAEGKAVARVDNMVVFVPFVVPGDIVDIKAVAKKRHYYEGKVVKFHHYAEKRVKPFCEHFGVCGGCKWQNMAYADQLIYKQKQVQDHFSRIGKFDFPEVKEIIASEKTRYYRNKLEYTFSSKRWLTDEQRIDNIEQASLNAAGFHYPGFFDKVVDITACHLQPEPSNGIRLAVKAYALEHELTFHDARQWTGFLRNLIIRTSSTGDIMAILVVGYRDQPLIDDLLSVIEKKFPEITSLMYVVNEKKNDTISDLEIEQFKGDPFIMEEMEGLKFKIGPISFYQTNSEQAHKLYSVARQFAGLTGSEVVYDLYTGTGTIANFIARNAQKVIGIEYVPEAIEDAKENSLLNTITNTNFFAGDMVKVLTPEFIAEHGTPDVIITDPPRAGMHPKVVDQIILTGAPKVVYVSCNPATQARDIAQMNDAYQVMAIQPVDMFPHTHHVENVVLLEKRPIRLSVLNPVVEAVS
ncbi:MAG: 23S rRNA (uracil(1939)-C(5))-methyltransferase RlmD [Bacteroidetes bacterium]|nr:23S rRNA (uracil(1939)-C(5))-methyltransferase RlmD [Bacteroidota bacterium]